MTMKEIARKLGVSQTTVSLTLSGKADQYGISAATQARVREYVQAAGYVPDSNAAAMAAGATRHVGIFIPADTSAMTEAHRAIFFGLLQALHRAEVTPLIQAVEAETCHDGLRVIAGRRADDLVAIGFSTIRLIEEGEDFAPLLKRRHLYYLDYMFSEEATAPARYPHTVRIGIDRRRSFRDALALLRDFGHRIIAAPASVLEYLPADGDVALRHLPVDSAGDDMYACGRRLAPAVRALMRDGCTAVMLRDDMVALGLITALRDDGVDVPRDLSVTGFDNIPATAYAAVPLTTIEVPAQTMLDALCARLLEDAAGPRDCLLPGQIIRRISAGPAPA